MTSPFAKNLEREIEKSGLSLTEIAKESDVSVATLSRMVSGQVNPSFANMKKIADVLGVSLDILAGSVEIKSIQKAGSYLEDKFLFPDADQHVLAAYLLEDTQYSVTEASRLLTSAANGTWQESWMDDYVNPENIQRVYPVLTMPAGRNKLMVHLAFPDGLIESGSIASLVSVLGAAMAGTGAKLVDVRIPPVLLRTFKGPSFDPTFTLGPKHHLKDRPFISATLRPISQLNQQFYYQSIYKSFMGGVDFTFDPSMMHSVSHLKWYDRVACASQAVHRARNENESIFPSHFINISAPTVEEMIKRAECALEHDMDTLMIDTAAVGWSALQSLCNWAENKQVTLAATGSRSLQTGNMSEQVMAKLLRLAGCHIISTPSPVSGSFNLSRRQVKGILHTLSKNNVTEDAELGLFYDQPMHGIYPSIAACGGGHTPWHFPRLLDLLNNTSIIQCGGTVFAHEGGPQSGAEANLCAIQALCNAKKQGNNLAVDGKHILKKAAHGNVPLKEALLKWPEDAFLFGVVGKPKDEPDSGTIHKL